MHHSLVSFLSNPHEDHRNRYVPTFSKRLWNPSAGWQFPCRFLKGLLTRTIQRIKGQGTSHPTIEARELFDFHSFPSLSFPSPRRSRFPFCIFFNLLPLQPRSNSSFVSRYFDRYIRDIFEDGIREKVSSLLWAGTYMDMFYASSCFVFNFVKFRFWK